MKEGWANLMKGIEGVGGKLYLTEDHLIHKSHAINIQTGEVHIPLLEIEDVSFYNNKLLFFTIKNGLKVTTANQRVYKFVINKRDAWKREIEEQIDVLKKTKHADLL
ncbi:GRAM domain-containing protein [Bacillus massilinigeriensis]|uniref:GRAM domain-containing protein n=1 Tax=Bacillus mediterraneensis TaxID=1805474 RepID=UPI00135635AC|nr:GRAM domain-containing protein [Bacillus mediterraneensis]